MKYRCTREVISAGGDQEFEVEADSLEEARGLFKSGEGVLVRCNAEVINLGEYDLEGIWEEGL